MPDDTGMFAALDQAIHRMESTVTGSVSTLGDKVDRLSGAVSAHSERLVRVETELIHIPGSDDVREIVTDAITAHAESCRALAPQAHSKPDTAAIFKWLLYTGILIGGALAGVAGVLGAQ